MLRIQIQICVVPNGHKVASLRRQEAERKQVHGVDQGNLESLLRSGAGSRASQIDWRFTRSGGILQCAEEGVGNCSSEAQNPGECWDV